MIEIRDTFQDAEIETPKASRGRGMGRGHRHPHPTRRSGGAEVDHFYVFAFQRFVQNASLTGENVNCMTLDTS